ncbi:MAG TPA: phosphatase PAP2 family protein [Sphingobium sp.]
MRPALPQFLRGRRIDSRILVVFLLIAGGAFAFLKLASEVMEGDTLAIDRMILEGLRSAADPSVPIGPGWLQGAMIDITALGGVTVLTLITVLIAGYLLASRKAGTAAFMVAAIAGGAVLSTVLKSEFARPRPDLVAHLVEVHTTSFPSGHAMNSAITYLTLGVLLARAEKGRHVRIYLLVVAITLTLIIGTSRVYLGVHWPSDVVAGWCVGACWAALCSMIARALQRNRTIEAATSSESEPATS